MVRSTPSDDRKSLLDEFRAESRKAKGPPCSMGALLTRLDELDRVHLVEAMADKTITGAIIADVLARHGWRVGHQTVTRHRAGRCACGDR